MPVSLPPGYRLSLGESRSEVKGKEEVCVVTPETGGKPTILSVIAVTAGVYRDCDRQEIGRGLGRRQWNPTHRKERDEWGARQALARRFKPTWVPHPNVAPFATLGGDFDLCMRQRKPAQAELGGG
jgi:hypothetical protein